jgi:hypothetical protein
VLSSEDEREYEWPLTRGVSQEDDVCLGRRRLLSKWRIATGHLRRDRKRLASFTKGKWLPIDSGKFSFRRSLPQGAQAAIVGLWTPHDRRLQWLRGVAFIPQVVGLPSVGGEYRQVFRKIASPQLRDSVFRE